MSKLTVVWSPFRLRIAVCFLRRRRPCNIRRRLLATLLPWVGEPVEVASARLRVIVEDDTAGRAPVLRGATIGRMIDPGRWM